MQQSTAKNLRDLLIKQQLNSKIHFKGEPIKVPLRKQSSTWECQCNLKHCAICARKKVNQSPMIRQQDSRRDVKVGSSISAHQSPNREKQSQILMNRQPSAKKPLYPDNVIYHKSNVSNSQVYEHSYQLKSKVVPKKVESKSMLSSTQMSFKLKLASKYSSANSANSINSQSRSEQILNSISESAPNSPKKDKPSYSRKSELNDKTQLVAQQVESLPPEIVGRQHFKFLYVIGKGGFGRVWKVEMKKNKKMYALKEMAKAKIIQKRSVNSVLNEKYLLEHLHHPFLVNMSYAFQDRDNLYLIIDLLTGGDLRFHLGKMRKFSEAQTKFFVACILLSLTYLHQHGIIHRDLKPENLVLEEDGYMRLTDLGIARINKGNNAGDTSGTPGYMAPEVMCRMDHSIVADYYALGVITYELMLGRRPYNGRTRQDIREQILAKQVQVRREEMPNYWSESAMDFVNTLIQRKPERRLGANGIEEILHHPWLKGFPWDDLLKKKLTALYTPGSVDNNFDFQNQISEETQLNEEQVLENQVMLRRDTVQALFDGYQYDAELSKLQHQQTQKNSQRRFQQSPDKK
ncbi:unnamed protein product (macronuclear) [Paramecium tetraurelia]|uniref:non-specific serine/threonine protein kinase n=1 Tax=Paramecium tetraurelia TaxID=5888 RepID=A0C8I8_PARTE|nr:uncharacterized protein GSPATT00036238001 [Paramecium tetraurelia]CAK67105.1 unnamed protein product [Paramecium tetraurelia]|eukprot:XP_001434502.1 hypothetical protein (macronuclear) [Paramecium tetraurelia strain d4-2]